MDRLSYVVLRKLLLPFIAQWRGRFALIQSEGVDGNPVAVRGDAIFRSVCYGRELSLGIL